MNAGKDAYVEKPIVQLIDEGTDVIEAAKKTGRIVQVGRQRVSSMLYQKAKDHTWVSSMLSKEKAR